MKTILSLLLLLTFAVSDIISQSADDGVTTFILVRHSEKVDDTRDPDLSEAGYERSTLLAKMLEQIEFNAVYSTDLIRTTETARPVAEKNGIDIQFYETSDPEKTANEWIEKHNGEYILVAGHSNSTPTFANALLGREHFKEKFDESDYGNILIVTISGDGERHILHMRF